MCIALKKEAKEAREELSKRREQEHEAARRSAELVSEIERQQTETPDARLRKQVKVYCRAKQKAVSAYFTNKKILHFGFVEQYTRFGILHRLKP